jgi:hypothetical protein
VDAGRATLNPGLRFEHIKGSIRDQTAPAGRFLPNCVFTQADYVDIAQLLGRQPEASAPPTISSATGRRR